MKNIFVFLLIITAISFTINSSAQVPNTWVQKADFGGMGRYDAVGFSIGTKGYIGTGGGPGGQFDLYNDFWVYDTITNAWTQKANFGGSPRFWAIGFSIGTKGYIGTGFNNNGCFNDFWEYDTATNAWTQKANFGGSPRYMAVGFNIGAKGYIGTGYTCASQSTNDFWEFDPTTNIWTQKANFGGTSRHSAVGFSIGDKGYIGTGVNSSFITMNDFWEFDPNNNSWIQKANFGGIARVLAVGFSIGDKGYIGIGKDQNSNFYNDFWEYNTSTDSWTQKTNFGGASRGYAVGFAIGPNGYIGTGWNEGPSFFKDFWEYTPSCPSPPPPTNTTPVADQTICAGTSTVLSASGTGTLGWYSADTGGLWFGGGTSYTTSILIADTAFYVQDSTCEASATRTRIPVTVIANLPISITISVSSNPFCPGSSVTFTATPINGGTTPSYQWKVNGINVGTNSATYSYIPVNNDAVTCVLTSNITCTTGNPASSATIIMSGSLAPVVTFSSCFDTITRVNAQPIRLKGGIPLGGTYSGAGVNSLTGIFTPSVAGTGTKTITYSYTNIAMCTASKSIHIIVQSTPVFTCGNNLTDIRDNQVYLTVQIGSQCWMASNLNYGTILASSQDQRDNCVPEKYCYNDNPINCTNQGGLYQWDEFMQYDDTPADQGFCPPGWHIPTENEWNTLFSNWTNNAFAGSHLKYSGNSGFNALLSGSRHMNSGWDFQGFATFFWSSTPRSSTQAWAHGMNDVDSSVSAYPSSRVNAFSVRCLQDYQSIANLPTVTTAAVTSITQFTATSGGDISSDGGASVTARGVCWNTSSNPTTAGSHTTDGTGTGTFVSNITGLTGGTLYYVRAYATNSVGTSYGNELTFSTLNVDGQPCPGIPTVTYAGQTYNTVQIGTQCWFKENLNVGKRINVSQDQTNNDTVEKYCFNNLESNCDVYGGLYLWNEMMQFSTTPGVQGICPTGWHLPTDAEWTTLTNYLGGISVAGGKMKETGTAHWLSPNTGATNSSEFTALPGGFRLGNFGNLTYNADFWSSTEGSSTSAWNRDLSYNHENVVRTNYNKTYGFSARCVHD
jgi:uncharacterized protein (TIGR02145 family)